ncbi:MAG TPA: alpha/beta hydrolase [Streptosporangiaceae bacterium]|nr:alpha/beta hydrolase [Streptosporangiaceae bacterium]
MTRADDGCRLWTADAGRGAPLIVCHGGPGLWDMFGSLADSLGGDVRVVRWDQRGCGRSERRGPYSVARSVADLDAVRAQLTVERVAVLGHSWGATLALRYALVHPDRVSALIYVSGTGLGWDWHEPFQRAIAERLAPSAARRAELRARARTPDRTEAEDRELADHCRTRYATRRRWPRRGSASTGSATSASGARFSGPGASPSWSRHAGRSRFRC